MASAALSPIVTVRSNHFGLVVVSLLEAAFPLGPQWRDGAAVAAAGNIVIDLK